MFRPEFINVFFRQLSRIASILLLLSLSTTSLKMLPAVYLVLFIFLISMFVVTYLANRKKNRTMNRQTGSRDKHNQLISLLLALKRGE